MVGWQFWAAPGMFVAVSVGFGFGALGGNPAIIFVFLLFGGVSVVLCLSAVRQYNKMAHDIERRVVEVIEGAPEHVWASRGFCYLAIAGRTIRVPNDVYGELRESNMVKIAFLPTSLVAVQVEAVRGMGLSQSFV